MALAPGTRLGDFEIIATLGVGGMGEVYRATDSRLKRHAAIKILPESIASDAERLSRFQREAELLASLNHPNIASVFGIAETHAGKALVMEVVEGIDLGERVTRGAVPIAEAMHIALQLVRAIAAAHGRGIIHRDLKPANIRLRDDGTVKVLDFGLAKSVARQRSDTDATVIATRAGTIMGTPRYMSPEQARGEAAGTQADIWAFGVILGELLTGRALFDAPSSVETLSRVLNDEPDLGALPSSLHPRIRLLLQRCLRKNQSHRLHHIGDAAIELEDASSTPVEPAPAPGRQRWPVALAVAATVALIGVGSWNWVARQDRDGARVIRSEIVASGESGFAPMGSRRVAISRDGQRIAIATSRVLQIRRLSEGAFVDVPGGPINPFFSPDGQWVGYFDAGESGSGLKIVPVTGGQPKMLYPTAERTAGGDWREDGTIVFAVASGVYLVRSDGTGFRTLAKPDAKAQERILAFPQFLRGTNSILYTSTSFDTSAGARLVMMDVDTSASRVVLSGGSSARYLPDGRLVYATFSRLKVVPFDPRQPVIAPDTAVDTDINIPAARDNGAADFAVSDAGDLVFLRLRTVSRPGAAWSGSIAKATRNRSAFRNKGGRTRAFLRMVRE